MANMFAMRTAVLALVMCPGACSAMQPFETHSQSQRNVSVIMVELPAPTGRFAIGTKIYNWVDRSRHELASKNPLDSRQVIVQVWYPTQDRSGPTAPYVPMLSSYRRVWEDSEVDVARRTLTHSRLNAKPMSGVQFPVVLLSHGWEGTRSEYTSFAEDLASHGYAVFGVDHPYMGRIALPNGEVTKPTENQFHSPAEIVAYYASDLEFVIRRITELNRADPEKTFPGKFDMARIAAIGHSSGFVAASGACKLDSRIRACINIDAPGFSASDLVGLDQPLLWIRLQKAGGVPAEYLKTARATVYELQIEAANHGSVEDWGYLEAASPAQREVANRVLQIIRQYVEGFLSKYLDHQSSDLLDPGSGKPGIQWRVYLPADRSNPSPKHP
jgi:pimeloyl-ACP methyl ester carboxylesterase